MTQPPEGESWGLGPSVGTRVNTEEVENGALRRTGQDHISVPERDLGIGVRNESRCDAGDLPQEDGSGWHGEGWGQPSLSPEHINDTPHHTRNSEKTTGRQWPRAFGAEVFGDGHVMVRAAGTCPSRTGQGPGALGAV